jgi:hypothetical protein
MLIGVFIMINPADAHMTNSYHKDEEQQEMWSDQSNTLIDASSEAGNQMSSNEMTISEDLKTILTVLLSLIGISVICFFGFAIGEVIEERIYSSVNGNY